MWLGLLLINVSLEVCDPIGEKGWFIGDYLPQYDLVFKHLHLHALSVYTA